MSRTPDLERARAYALERLGRELPPALAYHSLGHTGNDVVPAAKRLALAEGLNADAVTLVLTAAWFHDIGFVSGPDDHEAAGARIARAALPGFGYAPAEVAAVEGMILATRLPQAPRTLAERVVADADLDVLGREDFMARNRALREEWAALGRATSDEEWYGGQSRFLRGHAYFTASARALRDFQKRKNLEALLELLEAAWRGA